MIYDLFRAGRSRADTPVEQRRRCDAFVDERRGRRRLLTIEGDRAAAEAVLLAFAWDLAVAPWAEQTVITLVGVGKSSAEVLPDRLRFAEDWDEALCQASSSKATQVVLAADPPDAEHVRRLTSLLDKSGPEAVVTVHGAELPLPGAWRLKVGAARTFVGPLGEEVELQKLAPDQVDELVAVLARADEAVEVPAESYRNVPPEETGLPEPPPVHEPSLQVLGPVRLNGVDPQEVEAKKLNRLVELAAYLALHPGATADEISLKLGTDAQPWSAATRQGYISRLRTWLGRDANGDLYVPNVDARHGGYRMSETFGCDWRAFQELAQRGLARPEVSVPDLQEALDLVHGTPFGNVPAARYAWSSWLEREMIDSIVDVAHTLADAYPKAAGRSPSRDAGTASRSGE